MRLAFPTYAPSPSACVSILRRLALKFQTPPCIRFYKASQRAFLANIFVFRQPGSLFTRRIRDWFSSNFQKSLRCNEAPKGNPIPNILLTGCLISFAQDKITDDEFVKSAKSFSCHNPPTLSNNDTAATNSIQIPSNSEHIPIESSENSERPVFPETLISPCTEPPVTLFARRLRTHVLIYASQLLSTNLGYPADLPREIEVSSDSIDEPSIEKPLFSQLVSSALSSIELKPDGKGFVDESWELIVDRSDLHAWRRPLAAVATSGETVPVQHQTDSCVQFEYRVCGTMTDVSAAAFLEVQLNLPYRNKWDKKVAFLDYLASPNGITTNNTNFIRWVARFPFPLANREYIYARRWWYSLSTDSHQPGYALVVSRSCQLSPTEDQTGDVKSVELARNQQLVTVDSYRSEMLIKSHNDFYELGLDYYLTYYDNPHLPIGNSLQRLVPQKKVLDNFLSQLHSAASNIERSGLPSDIQPVLAALSRKAVDTITTSSNSQEVDIIESSSNNDLEPEASPSSQPSTSTARSSSKTTHFFADQPPLDSARLSSTLY